MDKEEEVKCQEVCEIGIKTWQREHIAADDGGTSVRLSDNMVLCIPTGISKGTLTPRMICKVRFDGSTISEGPPYKTSSEVKVCLRLYQEDSKVNTVVYVRPIYATAFAVDGKELVNKQVPENVLAIPVIPMAPYATPSTMQFARDAAPFVHRRTGCLVEIHGTLSWGGSLLAAYQNMERSEYTAQLTYLCEQLRSKSRQLPEDEIQKLISMCPQHGL